MSRIAVLIKEPGQKPRPFNIENELETLQYIVDGYIEVVQLGCDILAIVDEDGKLKGKAENFWLPYGDCLVGTIIFCSLDGEEFAGLSEDQAGLVHGWCE